MRLVSWIWFWYVLVGFIMGGGAVLIWNVLRSVKMNLVWYEWILLILSYAIFLFMAQTFIASFQEFEPKAAWFSLIFMGFPVLLLGVVLFRSIKKRYTRTKRVESVE